MAGVQTPLSTCPLANEQLSCFEEQAFADLTGRVAKHYGVRFSCLAVQSPDGIHLKARVGVLPRFLPLPASGQDLMCRHVVQRDIPIIIEDTAQCLRVRDDPLVKGAPQARFYCGMPVKKPYESTFVVGTLCLFDQAPKRLSLQDAACLMNAASEVSALFAKLSTGLPLWSVCMSQKQLVPIAGERSETLNTRLGEILDGEDLSDTDGEGDFKDTALTRVSTDFSSSPPVLASRPVSESESDSEPLASLPASVARKADATSDGEACFCRGGQIRGHTSQNMLSARDYETVPLEMKWPAFTDGHELDDSELSTWPKGLLVTAPSVERKYGIDTSTNTLKEFLVALGVDTDIVLPHFLKEDIDMESLLLLSEQDFILLGIAMGPRRKIQAALAGMAGVTAPKRTAREV